MQDTTTYADDQLIALIKTGSRRAFNEVYERYAQLVYVYAFRILKDEDECADAVQDIFVMLWVNRNDLEISNLRSYLLSAVKYRLIRSIQQSRRKEEILAIQLPVSPTIQENGLELKELKKVIAIFQENLPQKSRTIFQLSRNEYLSNREIAQKLGISEKTVENQMTISLRKLRLTLARMSFWAIFF